jgi:ABC-type glutathione transport system ATPase component
MQAASRLWSIADRVMVVEAGRIVANGPRDEVLEKLQAPQQKPTQEPEKPVAQ